MAHEVAEGFGGLFNRVLLKIANASEEDLWIMRDCDVVSLESLNNDASKAFYRGCIAAIDKELARRPKPKEEQS